MDNYLYFNIYSVPVILACLVTALLGFWAWDKGNKQGQKYFSFLMIASFLYSFFYLMELSTEEKSLMILFLKFQYAGSNFVAPFLLLFALKYSDNEFRMRRWQYILLFGIPFLFLVLTFTNEYHFMFNEDLVKVYNGVFFTLVTTKGVFYWIIQSYTILLTIVAIFFLLKMYVLVPRIYYKQITLMCSAIIISWIIYFLYLLDFSPYNLDLIPFAFAFSGVLIYIGFVKYGLFEIVPIAYKSLFDNLSHGVFVFDKNDNLITMNKGAGRMLNLYSNKIGRSLGEMMNIWPELGTIFGKEREEKSGEFFYEIDGRSVWFNVRSSYIEKSNIKKGFILIFTEITNEKIYQLDLMESRASAKMNELRLRTIIENAGDIFLIINSDLFLTYCSPNVEELLGYKTEELVGAPINKIIGRSQYTFTERLRTLFQSVQKTDSLDFLLHHLEKGDVWYSANLAPISFTDDVPDSVLIIARNITKQKKIEEDITLLSEEYEKVFNGTQYAMFLIEVVNGKDFFFVRNNETHQRLTGLSLEDFRGKTPEELLGNEVGASLLKNYKRCLELNTAITYEEEIALPGNTMIWSTTLTPVVKAGNKQYIVGTSIDITYKIDAQNAVIASENKFRSLVENASDIIFSLDLEGRFTYISPKSKNSLGYEPSDFLNKPFTLLIHPGDSHVNERALSQLIKEGKSVRNITCRILQSDGRYKWHITSASPLIDNRTGEVSIFGVTRDISEIKLAEQALRRSEHQAKKLAQQYETILNNQSVFIVKTDVKGYYTYVNQYFIDQFGEGENLLNTSALEFIIPEDIDACLTVVRECFRQPEIPHPVVLRKRCKDGSLKGGKWELKGILNEMNKVAEILCVGFDITDQLDSLKRMEHLLEVTSDQNQKLRSFTYIISHNIRSHSANLSGLAEMIMESDVEEERTSLLKLLKSSADQLDETLVNLNEVISINENVGKLKTRINIIERIDKTLDILHGEIEKNKVEIVKKLPEDPYFYTIPSYIDSTLLNLISNAIKYRSLVRQPKIIISVNRIEDRIELIFEDNGRGLDLEKYGKKLFGMYKTFHGNEDAKGLGLFITKAQIEAMGGNISVVSEVKKGSVFKIVLNAKG